MTEHLTQADGMDDGWRQVAEQMHGWHPSLQKHAERHLGMRGLLPPSLSDNQPQELVVTETEELSALDSLQLDTTDATKHSRQKELNSTRRKEEFKRRIPVVAYDQQRETRAKRTGEHYTSKRSIEERMRRRDAIEAELRLGGDANEESLFDQHEKQEAHQVIEYFGGLLDFLGESKQSNYEIVVEYEKITGTKARLEYFHAASITDQITLLCSDEFGYANYDNFTKALRFQQDFINGKAKTWRQEYDRERDEYVDVQQVLDPSNANSHDIQLGLKRASLRSAMIGTPEYGAYKMALQIRESNEDEHSRSPKDEFPTTNGYHSGITMDSIGDWETIIGQYQKYAEKFARRHPDLADAELEHGAVRYVARLYAKSMEYQRDRGQKSPYVSTFEESLAWAQLGEGVQAQLRGMRQKIQNIDLGGIERFVGKSGTSEKLQSYRREAYFLGRNIEIAKNGGSEAAELLERENTFALNKQERWKDRELARLEHKWSRKIGKTRSEERRSRYQQEWDAQVQQVVVSYDTEVAHYTDRELDTFIWDMEARQKVVQRRVEQRKSIAEKAINLHFALGTGREEWDEDRNSLVWRGATEYGQLIDWINDAPLGVIKRAHQRLRAGMSADEVCTTAISEVLTKVTGDESSDEVKAMFANFDTSKYEMQRMIQLAGALGSYNVTLNFDELRSMSAKNTRWIRESLDTFDFDDVRQFIDNGLNLSLVPKVKRVTGDFGYDLNTADLINFTKHRVINTYYYKEVEGVLSASLRNFTLDEVKKAMSDGIDLKVLNALDLYLWMKGVSDFSELANIAKKITDNSGGVDAGNKPIARYKIAVENIGLKRANDLLDINADIDMFNMVGREFVAQTGKDYQKTLNLTEKINRLVKANHHDDDDNATDNESTAIRTMKQRYSDDQILSLYDCNLTANDFVSIFGTPDDAASRKSLSFDMQVDILRNSTGESRLNVNSAIEYFDMDALKQLIDKGANIRSAHSIALQLNRDEKYKELNTIENITYLAANKLSVETFGETIRAGFSIDEIKRYPFLASGLLNNQPNVSSESNTGELADWERELLGITS